MKKSEAVACMGLLRAAYPKFEIPDESHALYVDVLSGIDAEAGSRAVKRAIMGCKFFPSLAEILDYVAEDAVACEPAEQAWAEVMRAISRWGRYRAWRFANPATHAAVDSVGKDNLCNSEDLVAERAHFMRIYASYRATALKAAREAPLLGRPMERPRIGEPTAIGKLLALPGKDQS
jgi:hypothetical protein